MSQAQESTPQPYDVLAIGETMLRFTPPGYERFQQATLIETHVGGSESNTAVGLARLGHRVAWFSRLTDNPLGRKISQAIAAHGVDTTHICWTAEDRVGTYYMERGSAPRGSQVYYDRANSAMCHLSETDIASELLSPDRVRCLHTTGITLGVSAQTCKATNALIEKARSAGVMISFDVNYRGKLWAAEKAASTCDSVAKLAELVFLPARDAANLYRVDVSSVQQAMNALHERWPQATVVMTRGADGAVAIDSSGKFFVQPAFAAQEVERLGGGDAFSAGFLSAHLDGHTVPDCLCWGAAAAAIKYTLPGDLPVLDRSMVESLVMQGGKSGVDR